MGGLVWFMLWSMLAPISGSAPDEAARSPAAEVLRHRAEFHARWRARHDGRTADVLELRAFPVSRLEYVFWLDAFLEKRRRGWARTLALLAYFELQSWQYGGLLDTQANEARGAELLGRLTLSPEKWRLAPHAFLPAVLATGGTGELAQRLAPAPAVRLAVEEAIWMDAWQRGDPFALPVEE